MLFILFLAAAAQATFFQPSKSNIQRCFDLTGDQDPKYAHSLGEHITTLTTQLL